MLSPHTLLTMSRHCALFVWTLLALVGVAQKAGGQAACGPIVPRSEWKALASECTERLSLPVRYVIISHTAGSTCSSPASCEQQARNVQHYHVREKGWCDVAYK